MDVPRFNSPPGWPRPPAGWRPPPGWSPDPSWPAPPPGWQFWLDADDDDAPGREDAVVTGHATPLPTTAPRPFTRAASRATVRGSARAFGVPGTVRSLHTQPYEQPDYVTRAITYPPQTSLPAGAVDTHRAGQLRVVRASGVRLAVLGAVLVVVGGALLLQDAGTQVLSVPMLGVGVVQMLRGLGRYNQAGSSLQRGEPTRW